MMLPLLFSEASQINHLNYCHKKADHIPQTQPEQMLISIQKSPEGSVQ